MKVICPKCQYENQADSTRVVCARCATIIDAGMDPAAGLENNGRRQTARLPFAVKPGNSQTSNSQPSNNQQLNQSHDVYATRIGDEFDDVLDIPRPAQSSYESAPVFDDVFTTPGYDSTAAYDFSTERKPTAPVDSFQTGSPSYRETQEYTASTEPEFMGWPVLPETSNEEEEEAGSFSAGRGGLLARIVLCALVFGGLVFGAYYFLGDMISKRKADTLITDGQNSGNQAGGSVPATAPSVDVKPAETKTQTVEPAKDDISKNTITPPVINPKPDNSQPSNTTATGAKPDKGDAKPVAIPPTMEGSKGHSTSPKPAPAPATPNKGNMTIQVASFNDQAQANERVGRLKSSGVDASVVRAEIPGKGTWYRVRIGRFGTRDEAMSYGSQLRSKNAIQDFIVTSVEK